MATHRRLLDSYFVRLGSCQHPHIGMSDDYGGLPRLGARSWQ